MSFNKKVNSELIVEEYKKRFSQILEYTFPTNSVLSEDGEEDETPEAEAEQGVEGEAQMGDDMTTDDTNNAMGMDMPQDMPQDMQQDEQNGEFEGNGGDDVTSGFNPSEIENDVDTMQPEDEVIDITDLTDAQEETQEDIEKFGAVFKKAFKSIKALEDMVNNTSTKIDDLSAELKKRNPTQMEKMSNRAAISYPFNVSPQEYWDEKEKTSNYRTEDDKNGKDSEEYTITVGDIAGANDWKNISDSFTNEFLHNQTLSNILKF